MTPYLQQNVLYPPQILKKPSLNLGIVIVIPCYNETELIFSLMSLHKCILPKSDIEVIIVINDSVLDSEAVKKQNQLMYELAMEWSTKNFQSKLRFFPLYHKDLPRKHAGVGLARKIGMDEAVYRFEKARNKRGVIVCFDADSKCDKNYLLAIDEHFEQNTKTQACSIHYEHPIDGHYFETEIYEAIILYELHLRYYINIQKYAKFPHAIQTIGSSMAVRADAYQRQGGMNKRKAGEDFYFLHKFTPLGKVSEIKTTKVIPSPRISDRVPFGTGKAVGELLESDEVYTTYAPQSFVDLKALFNKVRLLFKTENLASIILILPKSIQSFLDLQDAIKKIEEIKSNTNSASAFVNRFYRWFNAFMVMKYVHFARDHYYENIPVEEATKWLFANYYEQDESNTSAKELLLKMRTIDRTN